MSPFKPGMTIDDRFILKRRLGAGSTGVVWMASDAGRDVALKLLHPQMANNPLLVSQLEREASVLAQLAHPSIAQPVGFSARGEFIYLAMEFVEGIALHEDLGKRSRSHQPYRVPEFFRLFSQLTSAVSHAHARLIVHRDLKPQNVIVTEHGVKVIDFGIARLLEGSLFEATTFGRQLGSLFYMSPEQTRGEPADVRSDVFALGSILFELLTLHRAWAWDPEGRPVPAFAGPLPHSASNALASVVERIGRAPRPRPSLLRPELPTAFDAIISRALAIRANDRHQSVAELAEETERALTGAVRRLDRSHEALTHATHPADAHASSAPSSKDVPAETVIMAVDDFGRAVTSSSTSSIALNAQPKDTKAATQAFPETQVYGADLAPVKAGATALSRSSEQRPASSEGAPRPEASLSERTQVVRLAEPTRVSEFALPDESPEALQEITSFIETFEHDLRPSPRTPPKTLVGASMAIEAATSMRRPGWLFAAVVLVGISAASLAARLFLPRVQGSRSVRHDATPPRGLDPAISAGLAAVGARPHDSSALIELRDALLAAAESISDPAERERLRALAIAAAREGDAESLVACVQLIEKAIR